MSFVNTGFLWALAALAIPLWIHLRRRMQYRQLPVGSLRFLNEVLQERRRRSRFEEIPLLLLRLLCVILLAVVFCRPFVNSGVKAVADPAETVILLDASGSVTGAMKEEGMNYCQRAAADVAEGGKLTLAQFSDEVAVISGAGEWTPRAGAPTDLTRAMNWALDRRGGGEGGGGQSGKVVLIAHLAEGDVPPSPPRIWPPGVSLEVLALKPPSLENAALRQVTLLTPYVMEQMEIEAEVHLPTGTDRTVTLKAEGITITQTVPEGGDRVLFKLKPPRDEVRGTISISGGDDWPADDERPFAVRWVQPRRVLLVDGNPGNTPFEGQAYFVDKALTASGAAHGKTPFQPEIIYGLSARQGAADLSGVAAVALCGLPAVTTADARLLAQYVETGGGLLIALDARWTRGASAVLEAAGLLPSGIRPAAGDTMSALVEEVGPVRALTTWNRVHPILAPYDGKDGGDLREAEWRDGFDVPVDSGWKALATLDGGHALLLEKTPSTTSKGRVLVLAHSLTREWTDLPRDPLFVPLVKSLFTHVAQAEGASPELKPRHPGVHEDRPPGLYADAEGNTEIVAAAPSESVVNEVEITALRQAFGVPDVSLPVVTPQEDLALAKASVPWRHELWPWVAVALLILLMVENLVVTRRPQSSSAR